MYFEGGEFPFKQKYQAEKNWNLMRLNQIVTQRKKWAQENERAPITHNLETFNGGSKAIKFVINSMPTQMFNVLTCKHYKNN